MGINTLIRTLTVKGGERLKHYELGITLERATNTRVGMRESR
jgi:hypothetical protein